jgi:hypothetical protein
MLGFVHLAYCIVVRLDVVGLRHALSLDYLVLTFSAFLLSLLFSF